MVENMTRVLNEIDRIFDLQLQQRKQPHCQSLEARKQRLKKIESWIIAHQEDIGQALYNDFKKPFEETQLTEIFIALAEVRHALRHLKQWIKPRKVKRTRAMITTRSWIRYEPRGLVLIISPWNFPFHLCVVPLISAIAAGNCAVVKPSELAPHTAQLIKEMIESLFEPQEVAVFLGDYRIAQALLQKPFNHIFFTGSARVGKIVMEAAAKHLSSVTLELGGKSPVIIDQSANLKDAAQKVAFYKYLNSGQTCIAPDYILVHQAVFNRFAELLKAEVSHMFGRHRAQKLEAAYARINNGQHFQRLQKMLQEVTTGNGEIILGGEQDEQQNFMAPTLVKIHSFNNHLMNEEIFGPILPMIPFNTVDQALELINQFDRPLGVYIFSHDKTFVDQIMAQTDSGGVCINDALLQYLHLNLPFGGVQKSGFGNAHGFYGFRAFSYERAVLRQGKVSPLKWVYPPYTDFKRKLIQLLIKYFT